MSTERNVEARRLIAAQLTEQAERLRKADRRAQSLNTQLRKLATEREALKAETAGLHQALEALGGPLEAEAEA